MESTFRLIVGLGNPEKKYQQTRHNFGFLVVGYLAKEAGLKLAESPALKSLLAEGSVEGEKISLVLPLTYMNNSGLALKAIVQKKNIAPENILVVCDDLDLDFGVMRLRAQGAHGGHNGLDSIIRELGTWQFPRLKLGISRPARKEDVVDFVLSDFSLNEKKELPTVIKQAAECCKTWLRDGTESAMNQFNKRKEKEGHE